MATKSPTQRSLEEIRKRGWVVAVVERSSNFGGMFRRHDLFGIADLMYLSDGEAGLVQVTSGTNVAARIKKITDSEHIADIRKAGLRVWVHGWTKGKTGKYTLREVDLS